MQRSYNGTICENKAWYEHSSWLWHNPFFFCVFFHQNTNIIPIHNIIFEYGRKVGKVVAQVFRHFNITLDKTKESPIDTLLQELFFAERTFIGENCSKITFDWCISFIETPPLTLLHFNNLVTLLLYVISAHFILLSILDSPPNIGIC